MSYEAFLKDRFRREVLVAEVNRRHRTTGAASKLYFSGSPWTTSASDTPADTYFEAVMVEYPQTQIRVPAFDRFGLASSRSSGVLRLAQNRGHLDSIIDLDTYDYDGEDVVFLHGGSYSGGRLPYADFADVGRFVAETPEVGLHFVEFPLRDQLELFRDQLQTRRFRGSGYCSRVSSTSGSASLGSPAALDVTGDLTVSVWWWRPGSQSGAARIFTWYQGSSSTTWPWDVGVRGDGRPRLTYTHSSGTVSGIAFTTIDPWPVDRWVHAAFVRDSSAGEITCVLYDELTGEEWVETKAYTGTPDSADDILSFGIADAILLQSAIGMIDEVWIENDVVDLDIIRERRGQPLTDAEISEVLGYWPMNATSGTTISDQTANSNDATHVSGFGWVNSLEGPAGLAGTIKRDAFGKVRHATPIDAGPLDFVRYLHSEALPVIKGYEGGNEITVGTAYTDALAFLDATTASNKVDTLSTAYGSYLRWGFRLSLDEGFGSETQLGAGTPDHPARIAEHVLTTRGCFPLASVDQTWVDALISAVDSKADYVGEEGSTILDALDVLLGLSCGAIVWCRREGSVLWAQQLDGVPDLLVAGLPADDLRLAAAGTGGDSSVAIESASGKPLSGQLVRGATIELDGVVYTATAHVYADSDASITVPITPDLPGAVADETALDLYNYAAVITESVAVSMVPSTRPGAPAREVVVGWGPNYAQIDFEDLSSSGSMTEAWIDFLRLELRRANARVTDPSPLAEVVEYETTLEDRDASFAEAKRRLTLLRRQPEPWRLALPHSLFDLDVLDVVLVDIDDRGRDGSQQQRIGPVRVLVTDPSFGRRTDSYTVVWWR